LSPNGSSTAVMLLGTTMRCRRSATFPTINGANTMPRILPAFLSVPDRVITGGAERGLRKFVVRRFQLLKTHDAWRGLLQPFQQTGQPPVNAVDIVGRDPHRMLPQFHHIKPARIVSKNSISRTGTASAAPAIRLRSRQPGRAVYPLGEADWEANEIV
jgi:hypothetical protein